MKNNKMKLIQLLMELVGMFLVLIAAGEMKGWQYALMIIGMVIYGCSYLLKDNTK